MDVTDLPDDLFLLIARYLPPRACIRSRAVSRRWLAAFTAPHVCQLLLRWNFPRCREMRLASAASALRGALSTGPEAHGTSSLGGPRGLSEEAILAALPANLAAELRAVLAASCMSDEGEQEQDWAALFATAARRYYHLRRAKPRLVEKLDMSPAWIPPAASASPLFRFRGVQTWNRFLRLNDTTAPFHYPDPVWSYGQEDGILIYPIAAFGASPDAEEAINEGRVYHLLDLETGFRAPVPFDVREKLVRRIRLAEGVLIIEWAEASPYHQLNDREVVHRHFVTAFDVVRKFTEDDQSLQGSSSKAPAQEVLRWTWAVTLRSEWKLHFLGLPINRSDRFFSAHTANLYAVYFWQPNRSLYNDDPIEQLAVWDISSPSEYRPSEDPNGDLLPHPDAAPPRPTGLWGGLNGSAVVAARHPDQQTFDAAFRKDVGTSSHAPDSPWATAGPRVIRRMAWDELDFYSLRQSANPQLRNLALDEHNLYVVEEEHRWAEGQHSSLIPPRVHLVKCTGIPVVPMEEEGTSRPKKPQEEYRCGHEEIADQRVLRPVLGPRWIDTCGANGDINMSFCQRVGGTGMSEYSQRVRWLASINTAALADDVDVDVDGNGDAHQTDPGDTSPNQTEPPAPDSGVTWPWNLTSGPGGSGTTGSPTSAYIPKKKAPAAPSAAAIVSAIVNLTTSGRRWPGWAPCWRHEDFPYLTVSEIFDSGAGVRITARHCFMLETISVHVRPSVMVKGAPNPFRYATTHNEDGEDEDDESIADGGNGASESENSRGSLVPVDAGGQHQHSEGQILPLSDSSLGSLRRGERRKKKSVKENRNGEVQFADDMWSQLCAKGYIAGDERWIIGEDGEDKITIVRF